MPPERLPQIVMNSCSFDNFSQRLTILVRCGPIQVSSKNDKTQENKQISLLAQEPSKYIFNTRRTHRDCKPHCHCR